MKSKVKTDYQQRKDEQETHFTPHKHQSASSASDDKRQPS